MSTSGDRIPQDHDALVAWARRQQRLTSSISEFAVTMSSIRDHDAALARLVRQARTLLDVDLAYLSLNGSEHAATTSIVITDGVWTEEYRGLRMPLGTGVLGRVAASGIPVQTADYAPDGALVHDPEVTRIVEAEGVQAILGAPLHSEGRVIGALMAANRFPGRFSAEQVFIAQTLANLAAVALDNSGQIDDLNSRIASLAAELDARSGELETERSLTGADEALMDAIAGGGGLAQLREGMVRAIGRPVQLVDLTVRYDLRAAAADVGDAERPLFALSAQTGTPTRSIREDGTVTVVMAATRGDDLVGAVMVEGDLSSSEELVLQRCARVMGVFLSAQDRERGDTVRRRRELIQQVLSPGQGGLDAVTIGQLAELSIRSGSPFRILVADGSAASLRDFQHRLELDFGQTLLHALLEEQVIAIVPESAFERIRAELESRGARRWGALLLGHSPALHQFPLVPDEFALVNRVLEAARRSGHSDTLVSLATYGAIGAFLSKVTIEPTRRGIEEVLGPLLAYDRTHGAALVHTAGIYLDAGRSVAETARRLHVHENTVRQRIDRIAQLLGPAWDVGQQGLDCHIMVTANRLIGDTSMPDTPRRPTA